MKHRVRLTEQARSDLKRLYDHVLERDGDWDHAEHALEAIESGLRALEDFAYACRKAGDGNDPFLRELLVGFGRTGYVVLYRIDGDATVTVAAVRHQLEDDYH